MQVKIVPVTGVELDARRVEFVTNVAVPRTRSQPVVRVVMSNGPLISELHGTCCFCMSLSLLGSARGSVCSCRVSVLVHVCPVSICDFS